MRVVHGMATQKRRAFTAEEKLKLVDDYLKKSPSQSLTDFAKEQGIASSTLCTILKNKGNNPVNESTSMKKKQRKCQLGDLDKALYLWFKEARAKNIPLSGPIIKQKADNLAFSLGYQNWSCSQGWFFRWKVRNNLTNRSLCGEASLVNSEVISQWLSGDAKEILETYAAKDIFNGDETGLFWRMMPSRSYVTKDDPCHDGKKSKDRVTVMIAANSDGSEKLPLLVIGKFAKPRCFKNFHPPCPYMNSAKAWMTTQLFQKWLDTWNTRLSRQKRSVFGD